ncbi:hypothetical protein [Laceyella putida]|uniref:Uncharacterized protein n=1 Tax=Laceyella putida TaxID=110101 RepID=A0ABW2RL95_9BACL
MAWIFLGYIVFFGALILALGLLAFSVFTLATEGFKLGPLKLCMLRALKVKKYQPKGIVLSPEDAPQLFRIVKKNTSPIPMRRKQL